MCTSRSVGSQRHLLKRLPEGSDSPVCFLRCSQNRRPKRTKWRDSCLGGGAPKCCARDASVEQVTKKSCGAVLIFFFFLNTCDPTYLPQSMGTSVRKKNESKAEEVVRLTVIVINSDAMNICQCSALILANQRRGVWGRPLCYHVPVLALNSQPKVTSRRMKDGRWSCTTPEVMGSGTVPHLEHDSGTSPVSSLPCSCTMGRTPRTGRGACCQV